MAIASAEPKLTPYFAPSMRTLYPRHPFIGFSFATFGFTVSETLEDKGEHIVKTQGMTAAEVEAALARAGLKIPEREKPEIAAAAHFIEEMAARLRRKRTMAAEPAHIFPPPGEPFGAVIQADLRETTRRVLGSLTAREE